MDGFTYNNIFETKGIEYLVIIGFFAILIPFWIALSRRRSRLSVPKAASLSSENLAVPQGLLYSNAHTWVHLERNGKARFGIDDLVARAAGEAQLVMAHEPGKEIKKGEIIAFIENGDRRAGIHSPVSGTIESINETINSDPGTVFSDPTGEGWICRIEPADWRKETASYRLGKETASWFRIETERLREFFIKATSEYQSGAQPVLQDGGELRANPLNDFPAITWKEFGDKFLSSE